MNPVLLILGSILVGLAALVHVYIFYLESIAWSKPATWKNFGLKNQSEADTVKPMAFNQGYYNAFLAAGVVLGLVLLATPGLEQAGFTLAVFAASSMVLAAVVLITSSPKLARAAVLQGAAPLIGVVLLVLASCLG
jgi:putative membrane protein